MGVLKLVFSVLNPNHYVQNIGLIKYFILWKYAWEMLNGYLLQWCYFFVHMKVILLVLACSVFRNHPKYTEVSNFSFILPWHRLWWIHHECLRFSVDKCRPTAKVCSMCKVVCFLIRPFVSILERDCKLFKLQLKISARRKHVVIHCAF